MEILTSAQLRQAEKYTMKVQEISSLELMERAAAKFVEAFTDKFSPSYSIMIICGPGDNGGDGLAIARLLKSRNYHVTTVHAAFGKKLSAGNKKNLDRVPDVVKLEKFSDIEGMSAEVVIDALLGIGLNRPLEGDFNGVVNYINSLSTRVISVDIPSGMPSEGIISQDLIAVHATMVYTFTNPKMNFFFPESAPYVGNFRVLCIGLEVALGNGCFTLSAEHLGTLYRPRAKFSHKGTYGHALMVVGHKNTMGAALLSTLACLRGGAGLTTCCIPNSGLTALNSLLPEAMFIAQDAATLKHSVNKYSAIGIGPGLGSDVNANDLLSVCIGAQVPLVIDADGLSMLADNPKLLKLLPKETVLTPHMKEFDQLFGTHANWQARLATARKVAVENQFTIVLKNDYSFCVFPEETVYVNQTGNPGMASGGMGDVLTGLITALLAQGYSTRFAVMLGVYLHGAAGDSLAVKQTNMLGSEVADQIPFILKNLERARLDDIV